VRIVGAQPAAAVHIARRLFRTLVADAIEPPAGVFESLAAAMHNDGDVDRARGNRDAIGLSTRSNSFVVRGALTRAVQFAGHSTVQGDN
jgi:hypothetical protein